MAPSDNFSAASLTLSDIIHQMSPSPGPVGTAAPALGEQGQVQLQQQQHGISGAASNGNRISTSRYGSPATLFESESARVRKRLEEMGFSVAYQRDEDGDANAGNSSSFNGSSREKELVDMVIIPMSYPLFYLSIFDFLDVAEADF